MFPVPLNSSKMPSSMRDPVSTSALAMIVTEPPSSMFRAAPKNRRGGYSAEASMPPERILPARGHRQVVGAREPGQVVEHDHDVLPISASRFARSSTSSVIWMCWSVGLSNVE